MQGRAFAGVGEASATPRLADSGSPLEEPGPRMAGTSGTLGGLSQASPEALALAHHDRRAL